MRHTIVAGNWKMHKNAAETQQFVNDLIENMPNGKEVEVIIAPPFTNLLIATQTLEHTNIGVAAQNMHQAEGGAFTGEISADMLKSVGVNTVILGHSERRQYFKETNALLANKVDTALRHNMRVIFCVGEELNDRKNKQHLNVVYYQLKDSLFHLPKSAWNNIVLAYEPVWAIGTGETATPEQAQEMHQYIREQIAIQYDKEVAENTSILYGGSVKPENSKEIFSKPDVDGGLIGGAALKVEDFVNIINNG
ncbi:triose-phosphate isomerase [Capnocytophaga sp. ARDL2]|uniref:triose-phosphate isomerase n=1 Tax=Capnocytophaga sp. ARDL2 TaxID=3238809 RepID=UPI003556EBFF